jgi:plastocyanin
MTELQSLQHDTSPGGTYSFTFNTPGTYNYHCKVHPPSLYPSFVASITVTQ